MSESPLVFGDCCCCKKANTVIGYGRCASCNSDVKCPNYTFCNNSEPVWVMKFCHGGYCTSCETAFYNTKFYRTTLEFKPPDPQEPCSVCMESERTMMKFPNKECVHWLCIKCSKDILFWDETRTHLDPRPYGCPPCPNGCNNPTVGRQCYCEDYDAVQESWKSREPMQYNLWNEDEQNSIEREDTGFGTSKCPLCRRHTHDL